MASSRSGPGKPEYRHGPFYKAEFYEDQDARSNLWTEVVCSGAVHSAE